MELNCSVTLRNYFGNEHFMVLEVYIEKIKRTK